jgi:bacteriorhodopsin
MSQRLGGTTLAALAVALGIYSGISSWAWWLIAIFAFFGLVGVVLMMMPENKPNNEMEPSTAFIRGDASRSSLDTVYSDADYMVDGNARHAKFRNVTHRTRRRKG